MPGLAVGYVQRDGAVTEIQTGSTSEAVAESGLITHATVVGGELTTEIEPLAYGALRLEAPDGRVSHFPRAMCRVSTPDGRSGVGWIEFNRNQR
jgi:hypothetical protein